jgi:hypothetical protein
MPHLSDWCSTASLCLKNKRGNQIASVLVNQLHFAERAIVNKQLLFKLC